MFLLLKSIIVTMTMLMNMMMMIMAPRMEKGGNILESETMFKHSVVSMIVLSSSNDFPPSSKKYQVCKLKLYLVHGSRPVNSRMASSFSSSKAISKHPFFTSLTKLDE